MNAPTSQEPASTGDAPAPRTRWGLVFGLWSVPAWIGVVQQLAMPSGEGQVRPAEVVGTLFVWYSWALFTPGVLHLVRRFPFDPGRRARSVAVHVLAVAAITAIDMAVLVVLDGLWPEAGGEASGGLAGYGLRAAISLLPFAMIYGVVMSVGVGIELRRRYRAGQIAAARLEARAAQLERRLTESRLSALKTQLQPHFLFNTLHAIASLVDQDAAKARRMIARLSDLLRLTLDEDGPQEVPLAQEIETLERYLDIERVRLGDRLRVDYDIEAEALDVLVPSLVLQPLVENAVSHGIARVARPGRIEVRARRRDATVELAVIDDGAGCSEDVREGVGLGNTRARLAELYGEAARLEVEAGGERGFAVRLELPVEAPPLIPPKGTVELSPLIPPEGTVECAEPGS